MRIKSLEIQGFGPYLENQEVDFTSYESDGLFIIVGETGSGKSSILDAITFALYGITARWSDSKAVAKNRSIRSHFAKDEQTTQVRLQFEIGGREYRVTRSPEYSVANRKSAIPEDAQLEVLLKDGDYETLAMKPKNVAESLYSLLKLSSEEFLQVILLAQGRFDQFLKATSTERMDLLSKIFNTGRFKTLEERLNEIKKSVESELQQASSDFYAAIDSLVSQVEIDGPEAGSEMEWIEDLSESQRQALQAAENAQKKSLLAKKDAESNKAIAEYQAQLQSIEFELKSLESKAKAISKSKTLLLEASRANKVRATFNARNEAIESKNLAENELAIVAKEATSLKLDVSKKNLRDVLSVLLAGLEKLHVGEASLPILTKKIEELSLDVALKTEESDKKKIELTESSTKIEALEIKETEVGKATSLLENNRPILDKYNDLENLKSTIKSAKLQVSDLEEVNRIASKELEDAETAQHADMALILAAALVDGEPCSVCGSDKHPSPRSTKVKKSMGKNLDAFKKAALKAASDLAAMEALVIRDEETASGYALELKAHSIATLKKESEAASKTVEAWKKHSEELKALRAVAKPESSLNKTILALESIIPKLEGDLNVLSAERADLEKSIKANLGGFGSVSSRLIQERLRFDVLEDYTEKNSAFESAKKSLDSAEKALTLLLTKEKFASESEYSKSLLDDEEFDELSSQVKEHEDSITKYSSLKAQDIYKNLPASKLNLDDATDAFIEASKDYENDTLAFSQSQLILRSVEAAEVRLGSLAPKMQKLHESRVMHERLLNTISGKSPNTMNMTLETYVLAAELEAILEASNYHLQKLSKGQYSFQHTDKTIQKANTKTGLGIEVMDSHTSLARDAHSLSGGETFLASISLALGLAEVVTGRAGGISIDTLFIDEGFGSLSSEFLDLAIETLDSLRQGGRTIGVISHGETMKERIPSQIHVYKDPGGTSKILQPS